MSNESALPNGTGNASSGAGDTDPMPWHDGSLEGLRKDMLRFAQLQLRNRDLAEDVVQEALIAALAGRARFQGRAAAKTWVFGILKNKIIDVLRDSWNKKRVLLPDTAESDDDRAFDVLFNANERWQRTEMPAYWSDPHQTLENRQFWEILEICMTGMPEKNARVYSMREFLGMEVSEICKELSISPSNCSVMLHRARMALRVCLQQRWFGERSS
jgi:RNA polymerase sigma-70 factor (TIGR02943 family)